MRPFNEVIEGNGVMRKAKLPPFETIRIGLQNLVLPEHMKRAIIASFYLSWDCNAQCTFCSSKDKTGEGETDLDTQLEILRTIRRDVPNVYFLGGEPTIAPGFSELLEEADRLNFETVSVNTNGKKYRPEILEHATNLVFSLHSTDPRKISDIYHSNSDTGERVLSNFERYVKEKSPDTDMTVNSIATGDNVRDLLGVFKLCKKFGVKMAVAPAIDQEGKPDPSLIENPYYQALIGLLHNDSKLSGVTQDCLSTLIDFKPFHCTPNVQPGIYPNGDVVVPCPTFPDHKLINVLDVGGVNEAIRIGREQIDIDMDDCEDLCHKTCYIESAHVANLRGALRYALRLLERGCNKKI